MLASRCAAVATLVRASGPHPWISLRAPLEGQAFARQYPGSGPRLRALAGKTTLCRGGSAHVRGPDTLRHVEYKSHGSATAARSTHMLCSTQLERRTRASRRAPGGGRERLEWLTAWRSDWRKGSELSEGGGARVLVPAGSLAMHELGAPRRRGVLVWNSPSRSRSCFWMWF